MNRIRAAAIVKMHELVIAIICLAVVGMAYTSTQTMSSAPQAAVTIQDGQPNTIAVQQMVAQSHGFDLLISYTENGFEPKTATIHKGGTVRFTNNSNKNMWVAALAGDGAIYPHGQASCGQSALDTCHVLRPREFWEFTFTLVGKWSYQNNVNKSHTGSIVVE